jgi:hypothetical protein
MSRNQHKSTSHERTTRGDILESSIYLPDLLYGLVTTFAKSSEVTLEEAFRQLVSKGLVSKHARDYLDLLLRMNSLRRSELYSEYSKDGQTMRQLVDQLRTENSDIKRVLIEKGLLRKIPEKHQP